MKITKLLLIPIVAVAASLSFSANATTYKFVAANNDIGTQLCVTAANNRLYAYKRLAEMSRVKPTYIANKMTCNDQKVVAFLTRYNALKTAAFINRSSKHRVKIIDLAAGSAQPEKSDKVVIVTVH